MMEYWPDGEVAVYATHYEFCEVGLCGDQLIYRWLHDASDEHVDFRLVSDSKDPDVERFAEQYQGGYYEHGFRVPKKKVDRNENHIPPLRI